MEQTVIFLHGYGVRGSFWSGFARAFARGEGGAFDRVLTPDLDMTDVETLMETTATLVAEEAESRGPVCLVGHSMGGAVAAVTAQRLGSSAVRKLVCIATPYGGNSARGTGLIRFLIRHRLIPDFVARPRFFTRAPVYVQKAMFAKVVPENRAMQEAAMAEKYFHTELLGGSLPLPSMVIASEADRVVPSSQCRELSERIGATLHLFGPSDRVGHDDFVAAPEIALEVRRMITEFLS
ncbi:alpha/beta fold hydrolase [Salinispira pacifica]